MTLSTTERKAIKMGYESKIYIVRKGHAFSGEEKRYAQKLVEFELGKVYEISGTLSNYSKTDCYIYADDGDTQIIEDRYGEPLTECGICDLISIVKQAQKVSDYYMYDILLATLKEFERLNDSHIVCLHFGY